MTSHAKSDLANFWSSKFMSSNMGMIPVTVLGAKKMRDELHRLKTKDRYEVIQAIAEARSHGDLSENAEYEAAKERQGLLREELLN